MRRLEIRNVSAELLAGYLVAEAGGQDCGEGVVEGPGWVARFVRGEDVMVGLARVPVLFVEFEGPRAEIAAAFVRRKAMRGGG